MEDAAYDALFDELVAIEAEHPDLVFERPQDVAAEEAAA